MTLNHYFTQVLLPKYFSNGINKNFFYKYIAPNPDNIAIFVTKEAYKWLKEDMKRKETKNSEVSLTEEEATWPYGKISVYGDIREKSGYLVIFVEFPTDFVNEDLDSISFAVAMKGNPSLEETEIRYFILERDHSLIDGHPEMHICERDIKTGVHKNLGQIDLNGFYMRNFADKVFDILNKNGEKDV